MRRQCGALESKLSAHLEPALGAVKEDRSRALKAHAALQGRVEAARARTRHAAREMAAGKGGAAGGGRGDKLGELIRLLGLRGTLQAEEGAFRANVKRQLANLKVN